MTPREVMQTLAADWRRRGITYYTVAQLTGYKYQTIANFISNKRTYFSSSQAMKFKQFGYSPDFLMYGTGTLFPEDNVSTFVENDNNMLSDSYKLMFLLDCWKKIGDIYDDPLIQTIYLKFYRAVTTKDKIECSSALSEIHQLLALGMIQQGITYDQSGIPLRSPEDDKKRNERLKPGLIPPLDEN